MPNPQTDWPTAIYVGIGVSRYEHDDYKHKPLPKAVREVTEVGAVLEGYRYQVYVIEDPDEAGAKAELKSKLPKDVLGSGGSLVVLWSGHGEPAPEGTLRLMARNSEPGETPDLTAEYLAGIAARTGSGQILLILDTCYSGQGTIPAAAAADRVLRELPPVTQRVWFGVVASAMDLGRAKDGVFGARLLRLLREGPLDPELQRRWSAHNAGVRGDDLIDALLKEWDVPGQRPKSAMLGDAWVMFPNPRHDPQAPERIDESLLLAARGVEPGEEGVYFTGRTTPLERIVTWMHAGQPGTLVVTGPPGSGKSALLGRIVSLSNPDERARLQAAGPIEHADPGEGAVHAQVHAHGVTANRLVESIDEQLVRRGMLPSNLAGSRNRGELQGAIERSGTCPVIVIDGLDEARAEAWRIAEDVLRLLAPVARVLVGTRDLPPPAGGLSLVATLGPREIVDLGAAAELAAGQVDVRQYVNKRLADRVVFAMDAAKVGDAIVRLAREQREGLFLLARVITAQLRAEPIDTSQSDWESRLSHSVEAAFERDLSRVPPLPRGDRELPHAARELLTALAWAYGAGFPDDVWPIVATALSPTATTYQRQDVFWLLGQAGRYVVEDGEGGRAVYRMSHQRLVERLRPGTSTVRERAVVEERAARVAVAVVNYYRGLLAAGRSPGEPTYLWRYTWRHCADAGEVGIETLRSLVHQEETAFRPDLAMALNNLGNRYSEVGRRQEAVAPTEEAVSLYRELATTNPAFRPDLAMALNNLGIRYSEVGRRQEAVAPTEEAVSLRRELATTNPAFRPDLAMALNNLGICYREIGRGNEADGIWDTVIHSLENRSDKAFLLLRRAEARDPQDELVVNDVLAARSLIPDDDSDLISDLHALSRERRRHNPSAFDEMWRSISQSEPPAWLLIDDARLGLTVQWLNTRPDSAARQFLIEHAAELLDDATDVTLDEIALRLHVRSAIQRYRNLIHTARQIGVDQAYRPLLAAELLFGWMDANTEIKRAWLAERREALLGADVAQVLRRLRGEDPENPALITHEALLTLARSGQADVGFETLTDPEQTPARLKEFTRTGDVASLDALTTLALNVQASDAVYAWAWFHKGVALALVNEPDAALQAVSHARRLDPDQVMIWLGLLVELAARHPEVLPLSQTLITPAPPNEA